LSLVTSSLFAQENPPAVQTQIASAEGLVPKGISTPISIDLRGIDIVDAIKFLAVKGDLNMVTTKGVTGQVNLFLQLVTIQDALDILLLTNGLALESRGEILTVMTEAEYEELHGYRYNDQRQVRTLALRHGSCQW
jgi:type II secretory pathway component HofQ